MIINASSSVFLLNKQTEKSAIMHRQEISTTVMEYSIGFFVFKKFDKAVNSFVNPRDMHAFPTIQKKSRSKMTTMIYPSEKSSTNLQNRK